MKCFFHIRAGLLRILVPPDAVGLPARGHHVGRSIVIHIDGPLAAIGDKLAECAGLAILMPLPFAAVGAGILVPVRAAENVGIAISIHIQRGHAFRVIRSQAMREKRNLRQTARTSAGCGLAFRLRQSRSGNRHKENSEKRESAL